MLGGHCRPERICERLEIITAFLSASCFFGLPATEVLRHREDNWSTKFDLPRCGAGEDVEKICAISARDSRDRDFARCLSAGKRRLK